MSLCLGGGAGLLGRGLMTPTICWFCSSLPAQHQAACRPQPALLGDPSQRELAERCSARASASCPAPLIVAHFAEGLLKA